MDTLLWALIGLTTAVAFRAGLSKVAEAWNEFCRDS